MEAVCSSDMLVMTYQATALCHNLDENELVVDKRHTETNLFAFNITEQMFHDPKYGNTSIQTCAVHKELHLPNAGFNVCYMEQKFHTL